VSDNRDRDRLANDLVGALRDVLNRQSPTPGQPQSQVDEGSLLDTIRGVLAGRGPADRTGSGGLLGGGEGSRQEMNRRHQEEHQAMRLRHQQEREALLSRQAQERGAMGYPRETGPDGDGDEPADERGGPPWANEQAREQRPGHGLGKGPRGHGRGRGRGPR
jgi:hypothetical protein